MSDEPWLSRSLLEAGPCPRCRARSPRPVVYGLPDAETFQRLRGRVVFSGCVVPQVRHRWECGVCGTAYGAVG